MVLGDKQDTSSVLNINGKKINNSREIELLGIVIDNLLKFKKHIENQCKKVSFKLHALRRIRKFLTVEKAIILADTFINSQFSIPDNLRKRSRLSISSAKSVNFGTNSITFIGSLLWNNLPLR